MAGVSPQRVIASFAAVLALDSADLTTLGAVATHVEPAFHIDHAELGLLATVTALVGAVGTLPAGVLADRLTRTRLVGASILLWSVAMVGTYRRDVATAMASDEAQRRLGARSRLRARSLSTPWRRSPSPGRVHQ